MFFISIISFAEGVVLWLLVDAGLISEVLTGLIFLFIFLASGEVTTQLLISEVLGGFIFMLFFGFSEAASGEVTAHI